MVKPAPYNVSTDLRPIALTSKSLRHEVITWYVGVRSQYNLVTIPDHGQVNFDTTRFFLAVYYDTLPDLTVQPLEWWCTFTTCPCKYFINNQPPGSIMCEYIKHLAIVLTQTLEHTWHNRMANEHALQQSHMMPSLEEFDVYICWRVNDSKWNKMNSRDPEQLRWTQNNCPSGYDEWSRITHLFYERGLDFTIWYHGATLEELAKLDPPRQVVKWRR